MARMIKNRISDIRKAAKMSQSDLAEAIGATLSMVGKLERGERDLNSGWLEKISSALNCKPVELFVDDNHVVEMGEIGPDGVLVNDRNALDILEIEGYFEADHDDHSVARVRSIETQANATPLVLPRGSKLIFSFQDAFTEPFFGRLAIISSPSIPNGAVLVGSALPGTSPGLYHLIPFGGGAPTEDAKITTMIPISQIQLP
ncbi:MAG: hypothetical protein C0494_12595 [Sphingobium sp.]|nr:hypothetical protein [Sphingobium sp.]